MFGQQRERDTLPLSFVLKLQVFMVSLYKETDFKKINKIYLLMGTDCNMHCRHCIQTPIKAKGDRLLYKNTDSRVLSLIERYIEYCVNSKEQKTRYLILWGGEPLLYWDFIKEAVKELSEKYDVLQNRNFRFQITTNGSLLKDEQVEFFNKYEVRVMFSYDAPYPFAVRDYVSDEICSLVRKINGYEIECNYSAYNCDPLLAYRCTKAKFPEAKVQSNWRLIRSFDMPSDIYNFDKQKVRNSIKKARIAYQLDDPFMAKYIKNRFILPLSLKKDNAYPLFGSESLFCVDMTGQVRIAFNSGIIAGTIDEDMETLFTKMHRMRKDMLSDDCLICRNKDICRVCLYDEKKNGSFVSCKDYYLFFYDTVRDEMEKSKASLTEEDLLWYREQEEYMKQVIACYIKEGERYLNERTRLPSTPYF